MTEEKKLTDEEIVKALEICAKEKHCGLCEVRHFCEKIKLGAVDLIHRLQGENEKLKKPRKYILANKVYTDSTLKGWTKEDLIEQIRILEHNWACAEESLNNSVKNSDKIFAEQKAEIEQLTEKLDYFQKSSDYHEGNQKELEAKNTELQKQAFKDTAKEILQELCGHGTTYVKKWIKEHYGVEVE